MLCCVLYSVLQQDGPGRALALLLLGDGRETEEARVACFFVEESTCEGAFTRVASRKLTYNGAAAGNDSPAIAHQGTPNPSLSAVSDAYLD